jgi:hypothetical protein
MTGLAVLTENVGDVVRVRRLLVIRQMTLDTSRVHQLVVVVHMACDAGLTGMKARQLELCRTVVKRRRPPCRRGVTHLTILTEAVGNVVRIRRLLKIRLVALSTARIHKLVISIRVTRQTWYTGMVTCQRELRQVVIETRRLPRRRCMTGLTILTEVVGNVVRIRRLLKIRLVALGTVGVNKLVVSIDMARLTWLASMSTSQRKFCRVMIKCCGLPCISVVTGLAVLAKITCNVVRVRRLLKV